MSNHEKGIEAASELALDWARRLQSGNITSSKYALNIIQAYIERGNFAIVPLSSDSRMQQVGVDRFRTPNTKDPSLNAVVDRIYSDMVDAAPNPFKLNTSETYYPKLIPYAGKDD